MVNEYDTYNKWLKFFSVRMVQSIIQVFIIFFLIKSINAPKLICFIENPNLLAPLYVKNNLVKLSKIQTGLRL